MRNDSKNVVRLGLAAAAALALAACGPRREPTQVPTQVPTASAPALKDEVIACVTIVGSNAVVNPDRVKISYMNRQVVH